MEVSLMLYWFGALALLSASVLALSCVIGMWLMLTGSMPIGTI